MNNILLFGAGKAGEIFINHNRKYNLYNILSIIDNDKTKHGESINNIEVKGVEAIKLYNYDYIYIASYYRDEIKEQLINECKIDPRKIKFPNKTFMSENKSYEAFQDRKTYLLAEKLLIEIIDIFNKNNIRYFIDHGTLLGLVRDKAILPWDDDIDITVDENDIDRVLSCLVRNINSLPYSNKYKWRLKKYVDIDDKKLKKIMLILDENPNFNKFPLVITIYEYIDGKAVQSVTYSDIKYFNKHEKIIRYDREVRVPYNYEEYLSVLYGDWSEVKKNISIEDLRNYKKQEKLMKIKVI